MKLNCVIAATIVSIVSASHIRSSLKKKDSKITNLGIQRHPHNVLPAQLSLQEEGKEVSSLRASASLAWKDNVEVLQLPKVHEHRLLKKKNIFNKARNRHPTGRRRRRRRSKKQRAKAKKNGKSSKNNKEATSSIKSSERSKKFTTKPTSLSPSHGPYRTTKPTPSLSPSPSKGPYVSPTTTNPSSKSPSLSPSMSPTKAPIMMEQCLVEETTKTYTNIDEFKLAVDKCNYTAPLAQTWIDDPYKMKILEETDVRIVLEVIPGHLSSIFTADKIVIKWFHLTFDYAFAEPAIVYSKKARELSAFWLIKAYPGLVEMSSPEGLDNLVSSGKRRLDNPGCDAPYPDYSCALGCCAVHDECYDVYLCTASSWLCNGGIGDDDCTDECETCNSDAVNCVVGNLGDDCQEINSCYDNCRNEFFDCPGKCNFWDLSDEKCCGCRDIYEDTKKCPDGECIPKDSCCVGERKCPDGSCRSLLCCDGEKRCPSGNCVLKQDSCCPDAPKCTFLPSHNREYCIEGDCCPPSKLCVYNFEAYCPPPGSTYDCHS